MWQQYADDHIRVHFPVVGLKRQADVPATITSMDSTVFKVYVMNWSFLGCAFERHISDCVSIVRDKMLNDRERTCALFIAPNTGPHKQTYEEAAADKARRDVLDTLRDDANEFCVADVTVFFDPATMWSQTRRTKLEILLCTSSRRDGTGLLRSFFSASSLVVRQSLSAWVTCLPRNEFVDPTARISVQRRNLSSSKERAQWITGESSYSTIARDLWANMPVSSQDVRVGLTWSGTTNSCLSPLWAVSARPMQAHRRRCVAPSSEPTQNVKVGTSRTFRIIASLRSCAAIARKRNTTCPAHQTCRLRPRRRACS